MSFSFSSLIRLLVLLAVGTTMLAVGLSRLDPPRPSWRTISPTKYANINEYFFNVASRIPRWLDAETGQVATYPTEECHVLEAASCSPWGDEKGQRQVIGRWTNRTSPGPMSVSTDFGLARFTFPDGKLLDHVSTELVPAGAPCWYPGTRARVMFAAGDGMLYHLAFEPEPSLKAADPGAKGDPAPRPISWQCSKPGTGAIFISDLSRPEDPRLNGFVLVSLREQEANTQARRSFSQCKLWWLKLDLAGTEVVEAGPLLIADDLDANSKLYEFRTPVVGTLGDGSLALAYLRQRVRGVGWELRVAPIEPTTDGGAPKALDSKSVLLASKCPPVSPIFSADGRWLNAMVIPAPKVGEVVRHPTDNLFKASR
jgi:hypothetical protein